MKDNDIELSKFLSLILRHEPDVIGVELDKNGWCNILSLIKKINQESKFAIDIIRLKNIVDTNPKKRFVIDESLMKIRANQGHSINVNLNLELKMPPEILYHGTATKNLESILIKGLVKGKRQHVHLSSDLDTALRVGQRHGKPIVFIVDTKSMYDDNFEFFLSENNVWLTNYVPEKYLIKK